MSIGDDGFFDGVDPDYFGDNDSYDDSDKDELDSDDLYNDDRLVEEIIREEKSEKSGISATTLGLALSFADEVRDEERERLSYQRSGKKKVKLHEVDENTDKENMRKAQKYMSLTSREERASNLRPFEQYIDDICKGKRPLFPRKNDLY